MRATLEELSSRSWSAIDAELRAPASLDVSIIAESGSILGAFQRSCDDPRASFVRASGGSSLSVAEGTIHVALALATHDALVSCTREQILNRYVRPLLRALTKVGALAHYFGRDWISVLHRPAAFVGFAHDAASARTSFEAFVGVREPLWTEVRASHAGKSPASLEELTGKALEPERVAAAIEQAYSQAYGPLPRTERSAPARSVTHQPPWKAEVAEAIGAVCAGPDAAGTLCVGGELMISRDAISSLETAVKSLPPSPSDDAIGQAVDDVVGAPGVALFGVRSLGSIREVIARALR